MVVIGVASLSALSAVAQTPGVVSGIVTNETTGEPVEATVVTLSRFDRQAPESVDVTTVTDSIGAYRFEGVDTADGLVHAISVDYSEVLYSSTMIQMNVTPTATVDLAVYETTTDQSALTISTRALILTGIDLDTGVLAMTDVFTFENKGVVTIVADDDGRTLQLTVPDVASQVSLRPGFNFGTASVEGTTVFATSPVRPGTSTPSLDYTVPVTDSRLTLNVESTYQTESLRVLVPITSDLADVTVAENEGSIEDGGIVDIGEKQFHVWTTEQLAPDEPLTLSIENLPELNIDRNHLRTIEPAVIALLAFLVASGVAAWLVAKRGLVLPRPVAVAPAATAVLNARREELAAELHFIEDQHNEHQIDETAYRFERRAILEELRAISRQMRGLGDEE